MNIKLESIKNRLIKMEPWNSNIILTQQGEIHGCITDSERTDIIECLSDGFTEDETIRFMIAQQGKLQDGFDTLYSWLEDHTNDISLHGDQSLRLATGEILGYYFRLFEEPDTSAWCGIEDETAESGKWPAFDNEFELDTWYLKQTQND